jgi:hypothetical protein
MNDSPDVERETDVTALERRNATPTRDEQLEAEERRARSEGDLSDRATIGDDIESELDLEAPE